ncbi:MAG TPA: 50S ribosomal protein L13 [Methanomassiliicoccales archaeon]|jgi:large subunit ribosomal protein L13|nr:50S ribosomal protein L13 [Methanomassiliicoccales archaeon]
MVAVIDAENHIAGRLATVVAKRLLKGEEIVIVNAEKIIITGERDSVLAAYKQKKDLGNVKSGPFFPRRADLIMKRTVRGMLPWQTTSGREAYRRLKVYVGVPKEFVDAQKEKVDVAIKTGLTQYVTLSQIAEFLGSRVK